MCLEGYGQVETADDRKSMRFQKGETLFLPAGIGQCHIVSETEVLKIRC